MNDYRVALDSFEGPLDLLLHLIRKNDLDIYDIPIATILEQYLGFIGQAEELNINLAGEFLYMASELAYIKSKMLLPMDELEEESGPDPREGLMEKLLTYEKFKRAAEALAARPMLGRELFAPPPEATETLESEEEMVEMEITALLNAFHRVWSRLSVENYHQVWVDRTSVAQRMLDLVDRLKGVRNLDWLELFEGVSNRYDLVITFLALLEMSRLKMIQLSQKDRFGSLQVHSQLMEA